MTFFESLKTHTETDAQYRSAAAIVWFTIILFSGLLVLCSYNCYRGLII